MTLNKLTIKEASEKLQKRKITAVQLTRACLARIKEVDGKIKACITVCDDKAMEMAREADIRLKNGENGDLLGIPYLVKDNIMTRGIKTTASSKILENYTAPFSAAIIKKLNQAGAVILGKTNLDEFAHGASTENSAFGPTHNPWNLDRVPGGSSGGSAAAVAANMCIFALGTDTGGSIRHPASFCSVTGLKPTYGRSSRFGLIAMTSSTDVPGPLTKTVADAGIVLAAIAGQDKNDATTPDEPVPDYGQDIDKSVKGLKIGLPREYFTGGLNKEVKQAIDAAIKELKKQGAEFLEVSLPHTKYGIASYYIITPSEISSNLARFDGIRYGFSAKETEDLITGYTKSRGHGFGPEVKRRIMLGTYALSAGYFDAYYLQAQKVRTIIKEEMDEVLSSVDCLLTPTSPGTAFKIGEQSGDPLQMYLEDVFVTGASLAGLPAMSIPAGFVNGLPVGMQLIGKRFDEATLFRVGHSFQTTTEWHREKPEL
ncbi:Asp-tRNA(Asn)/Glu-tRNA(Gln) amidotransferase GatCAB subunit A [Candidatus Falkowbacteria bacterium]|nr:MAG: Asp-tRNA(Asn)/Glu-tRNA(Gln) amidotransferase GatCAB subunit A [Candidatus Falkowbacteria bacterium]